MMAAPVLPKEELLPHPKITPINEKSTPLINKKPIARKQSILRGTASSMAKAVRPPVENSIQQRKLSIKTRKPSLNNMLLTGSAQPNLTQRRSSWSPFTLNSQIERKTPSPSQVSPETKEPEVANNKSIHSKSSSSTSTCSSSVSTRVHSSSPHQEEIKFKYNDALPHAASIENNQQKQTIPLETPPPDDIVMMMDEEVLNIRSSSTSPTHPHHHHNCEEQDNEDVPGYMRRPICAACNRKVKVTSSTESNTIPKPSSRRSSIVSNSTTTKRRVSPHISTSDNASFESSSFSSPTSPIPSKRTGEKRKSSLKEIVTTQQEEAEEEKEEEEKKGIVSLDQNSEMSSSTSSSSEEEEQDNSDTWNQLFTQQKKLIDFINKDSVQQVPLPTLNKRDETLILETQVELLKRFETILSSQSTIVQTPPSPPQQLPITSWQTQVEFSLTRLKWNLSQWFGTLVGTGTIQEKDFDLLGHTQNVVISGVCVTTEPGLLPKSLQKYHRLHQPHEVVCYKYMIHLDRTSRLSKFALSTQWDLDEQVTACSFSIREEHYTKHCSIQFGVFYRRHHCRSCGHIYCQSHCSNRLPLFITNGEERGEWSRVCDSCFYARIEPQFIARS